MTRVLIANQESVRRAARIVREGGLVIYPTDTVYGLGCDPFNVRAVRRLIAAKRRPRKPLPVLASSIKDAERIAALTGRARMLALKFWPGSLTIVLRKREALPDVVTAGRGTVALRIPSNRIALRLTELSGGLLVGTSANISGGKPPITAAEAERELGDAVDVIIDGGPSSLRKPSTVVDATGEEIRLLREGPIEYDVVARAVGRWKEGRTCL
ncbi:TPA: threonylcarbamoyl-AMP synthase [Candidatus Bathyarchaeota archaeon]|nr:threonylcarbamoyl-AMP synthase [Candidatus Bathyarchaeota archaeon]